MTRRDGAHTQFGEVLDESKDPYHLLTADLYCGERDDLNATRQKGSQILLFTFFQLRLRKYNYLQLVCGKELRSLISSNTNYQWRNVTVYVYRTSCQYCFLWLHLILLSLQCWGDYPRRQTDEFFILVWKDECFAHVNATFQSYKGLCNMCTLQLWIVIPVQGYPNRGVAKRHKQQHLTPLLFPSTVIQHSALSTQQLSSRCNTFYVFFYNVAVRS